MKTTDWTRILKSTFHDSHHVRIRWYHIPPDRTACYKRANTPIFEKPKPHDQDQGWVIDDEGIIQPKWTNGPVLPQSLIDLMADHSETEEDEDVDIEVEVDEYDIEEENDEL